ncbi:uncharacterized protein F4807DRAFT_41407 [Annulohypoxylon truncatum]|uniref:uncharacterized protein n=1 Tax=Annulohypoxylon truncatum TaxID=327061 RepID=UPI0020080802|nr:uncharacterized protein F4807DRAFT_41407 [Annulohypoxylon truncatum]KAI1210863.1 hypothetical protein F4807DRAFT_41407 [Annulohypoxylon truncatum]
MEFKEAGVRVARSCGRKVGKVLVEFILLSYNDNNETNSRDREFTFAHRSVTPQSSPLWELDGRQLREIIEVNKNPDEKDNVCLDLARKIDNRLYDIAKQEFIPRPSSPTLDMPPQDFRPCCRVLDFPDEEELVLPESAMGNSRQIELGPGMGTVRVDKLFKYEESLESDPSDIDEDDGEYMATQPKDDDEGKDKDVKPTENDSAKRVPDIVITQA